MSAETIVVWGTSYILCLNSGTAELIVLVPKILRNMVSTLTWSHICPILASLHLLQNQI